MPALAWMVFPLWASGGWGVGGAWLSVPHPPESEISQLNPTGPCYSALRTHRAMWELYKHNTQPYITATTHRHTIWGASQPICCLLTFASRSSQLRPLSVYSLMHIAHDLIGWLYMSVHRAFYGCTVLGVSTFLLVLCIQLFTERAVNNS